MRCVVDTSVLLDILDDYSHFAAQSVERLEAALEEHALVVPPFVFCELLVSPGRTPMDIEEFLELANIALVADVPLTVYAEAATRYAAYLARRRRAPGEIQCPQCGTVSRPSCPHCDRPLSQRKMPSDFLIGAFAVRAGDGRILTRDADVLGTYFSDVVLV